MRFLFNKMQPFTFRLIIAASLFTLITGASLIWWIAQVPENPQIPAAKASIELPSAKASFDPKVYSVPFCELVNNPVAYDRKLIRMQAVFVNGVDWVYLASDLCPDADGSVEAVGPTEPDDKLIESKSRDQIGPLIDKFIREGRPLEVKAEMLGRFYAGGSDGRGHQFAIIANSNARSTGRRMRR